MRERVFVQKGSDMYVIVGRSAWEWWRTPPVLREVEVSAKEVLQQLGANVAKKLPLARSRRIGGAAAAVRERLLSDLKGLSLPIDMAVPGGECNGETRLVRPHRLSTSIPPSCLVNLGNGLYVSSPELTFMQLARTVELPRLIEMMTEACGLYAVVPKTARVALASSKLESLARSGECSVRGGMNMFLDERGLPAGRCDSTGLEYPWVPCVNRRGLWTSLWKRPPITSVEDIRRVADDCKGIGGRRIVLRAVSHTHEGSGSPLETRVVLMLCLPPLLGGEHFPRPQMNRKIVFSERAAVVAGMPYCIADLLWESEHMVIEALGEDYHVDDYGFAESTGRGAALEADGYSVLEMTYSQVAHLEQWDTMVCLVATKLSRPARERTTSFLQHRNELHRALFTDRGDGQMAF